MKVVLKSFMALMLTIVILLVVVLIYRLVNNIGKWISDNPVATVDIMKVVGVIILFFICYRVVNYIVSK